MLVVLLPLHLAWMVAIAAAVVAVVVAVLGLGLSAVVMQWCY
jgi:hypothetical protein